MRHSFHFEKSLSDGDGYIDGYIEDADSEIGSPASLRIKQIRVDDNIKGKGLGTFLLGELERYCRENGINEIYGTISSDEVSMVLNFYRKNGYQIEEIFGDFEFFKSLEC